MTSTSQRSEALAGRLGVTARYDDDDQLYLDVTPTPQILRHGVVRASVLSFIVDAVAGIPIDDDVDYWTMTTDMSVRIWPVPAPAQIEGTNHVLRRSKRSVTNAVDLYDEHGTTVGAGVAGFVRVPRAPGDPQKATIHRDYILGAFQGRTDLAAPLREEAGIEVVDGAAGVVEASLERLRNTAGTLQGAMAALIAESAAEDLLTARFGGPLVVTDLDLRYLSRTGDGPVRTRSRLLGIDEHASVEVSIVDTSTDTLTTLVHARAARVAAPSPD